LAVDWYRIKLEDAIGAQTPDAAAAACFDPAFNPTFDPNTTACRAIQRDPNTGAPGSLSVTYSNAGQIDTSGIDLQLDWGSALADMGLPGPGAFSINFLLNYLDKFESSTT